MFPGSRPGKTGAVDTTKVLLANKPKMLRELLRKSLATHADMEVVGEVTDPVRVLMKVRETGCNVVIVSLPESGEEPGICSHLLLEYPDLVVLAVSPVRDLAVAYRLSIDRTEIEGFSTESLVGVIRRACGGGVAQLARKLS